MGIELTKPWQPLTEETVGRLPGQLGVYQLADALGNVLYIGFAGGRSLFGLRSELQGRLGSQGATQFRHEVNMQYTSRHRELLMAHKARHGRLPILNTDAPPLGRIHLT